ncbi:MAG: hypothetical protein AB7T49_17780 [Oligoflexales bacterium]
MKIVQALIACSALVAHGALANCLPQGTFEGEASWSYDSEEGYQSIFTETEEASAKTEIGTNWIKVRYASDSPYDVDLNYVCGNGAEIGFVNAAGESIGSGYCISGEEAQECVFNIGLPNGSHMAEVWQINSNGQLIKEGSRSTTGESSSFLLYERLARN